MKTRGKEGNARFLKKLAGAHGTDITGGHERFAEACEKLRSEDRSAPTSPLRFNSIAEPAILDTTLIV